MSQSIYKNRYPGIRAFEKNERHVFFGRRVEAKKLYNLVKAKPLVVLFSKSGIGKSSLINAGLVPLIEKDYYQVVKIRLQTTAISSVDMVINELKPYLNEAKLKQNTNGKPGLWEYLRACEFKQGEDELTPVLVFDQFEEFFEHSKEDQAQLTRELADMVSDRLPERIQSSLRSIPFRNRTKEQLEWHTPIPVKFIFAIRSDRMSQMDEMSNQIPSILHNRFHLKPLGIEAAKEAIVQPAIILGDDFSTPSFTYSDQALETIIDYLKNRNDEIESFQLQLLCQNIEKQVRRKNQANVVVKESDFGGSKGIASILNNYYEQEIAELEEAERPLARKFIEEGLIVAGRRVGVSEGVEEQSFGITKNLLTKLLTSRLIRAENTHLGRSFELSHDTLVAPILQSYDIRRRAEERAEARRIQAEQEELINAERKKRNRARLLAVAGFLLFAISAAAGFYAARLYVVAEDAKNLAEVAKKEAVESRDQANEALEQLELAQLEMAKTNLETGKTNYELGNYDIAIENFKTVSDLRQNINDTIAVANKDIWEEAKTYSTRAKEVGGVRKTYDRYNEVGQRALDNGRYIDAFSNFKQARELNVNNNANTIARNKMDEAANRLVPEYTDKLRRAKIFIDAEDCNRAIRELRKAEKIKNLLPQKFNRADIQMLNDLKRKCNR